MSWIPVWVFFPFIITAKVYKDFSTASKLRKFDHFPTVLLRNPILYKKEKTKLKFMGVSKLQAGSAFGMKAHRAKRAKVNFFKLNFVLLDHALNHRCHLFHRWFWNAKLKSIEQISSWWSNSRLCFACSSPANIVFVIMLCRRALHNNVRATNLRKKKIPMYWGWFIGWGWEYAYIHIKCSQQFWWLRKTKSREWKIVYVFV